MPATITPLQKPKQASRNLTQEIEGGVATPALAERIGGWAAEHTQRQVLERLRRDHGVHWSSPLKVHT
jgi:hypothetical protein